MKKFLYIILAAVFVASAGLGIATRMSHTDRFRDPAGLDKAELWVSTPYDPYYDKEYRARLREEYGSADIWVRVKALDEVFMEDQSIRHRLKILEVYRGDITEGSIIDYYEANFFTASTLDKKALGLYNMSVTTLMKPGEEYLLFANKGLYNRYYLEKNGADIYKPASYELTYFALHDYENKITPKEEGKPLYYGDIKEQEFIFFCRQDEIGITKYKEMILEKFGIEIQK